MALSQGSFSSMLTLGRAYGFQKSGSFVKEHAKLCNCDLRTNPPPFSPPERMKIYFGGDSGGNLYQRGPKGNLTYGGIQGIKEDTDIWYWDCKWECDAGNGIKDVVNKMRQSVPVINKEFDAAFFFMNWNGRQDPKLWTWVGEPE